MKLFKNIQLSIAAIFALAIGGLSISCSDEDSGMEVAAPQIDNVIIADTTAIVPVTIGYADNMYIIRGRALASVKKIYFNDTDTYFNPALVTDNSIFVTIDRLTPYENQPDKLRVETDYGVAEFDFVIAPPAPALSSFNPINATEGQTITIYGSFFLDPEVTIGGTPATIVSQTTTQLEVTVPANSDKKYVTVTTISGSSTSKQAIGTAIFDDAITNLVAGASSWAGQPIDFDNPDAVQGEESIKYTFPGYSGLQMDLNGISTTGYSGIRVSLKGTVGNKVQLIINGTFNPPNGTNILTFTTEWQDFYLPFSAFGVSNLTSLNQLVFQEWGNPGGNTIFIDDIGLVLSE